MKRFNFSVQMKIVVSWSEIKLVLVAGAHAGVLLTSTGSVMVSKAEKRPLPTAEGQISHFLALQ
jgi:hypothetical protein